MSSLTTMGAGWAGTFKVPFTEAFLISLSSRLTASVLGAVGWGLRKRLSDPD